MHHDDPMILPRVARLRREHVQPALYRRTASLEISAWVAPGEPVSFAEAQGQSYAPLALGEAWGRPWGTVWFHVTGTVPAEWADIADTSIELVADLGASGQQPGFAAEGLVYTAEGVVLKAIEPRNQAVTLAGDAPIDLYLEAAANPNVGGDWTFAPTPYGSLETAGSELLYRLARLEVGLLDTQVWALEQDFFALVGLSQELPESSQRRAEVIRALDRAVDAIDPEDVSGTAVDARAALAPALTTPAAASAHHLHAVGHAHIDSAWLWPTRETIRKVARTFANVCDLIERSETGGAGDFVFAASSAQQYAWLKESHPDLFARVKRHIAAGRFVPVGGMWVESDTNLPGGEALARQFVAGKQFFLDEFGVESEEVWLPDSFGYSAALPQIVKASGSRWFLTQKISWNQTNTMPHHTFRWEGIDGTRIFTHFPPVDTYNSELSAEELARAERQYAEKGSGTMSLVPFGFGDGGGGPTREMVAAAHRTADLEGSPTVVLSSPRRFFTEAEADLPQPPVWSGELYLEFHRGTYTSQARTKQGNRRSEHLLREAELWATTAAVRMGTAYPVEALTKAWHTVLLQQFHDILPGSSIAWVHQEAERNYAEVAKVLGGLIDTSLRALAGSGDLTVAANAGPFATAGTPALGAAATEPPLVVTAQPSGAGFVLENESLRVTVDAQGLIRSLYDRAADRELVPAGEAGNLLQLHRDTPVQWDAWDLDQHYRRTRTDLTEVDSIESTPEGLRITRSFGRSHVVQTLTLDPTEPVLHLRLELDWHERRKLLKLAFPLDVHADRAASEIQFGHIHRPTHVNTSWDVARFETVAHRWVHVGEADYGVAVANDATYGHDINRSETAEGLAAGTTVRLSLLRAPTFPDPTADQGRHTLNVALRVGATIGDAVREGYRRNLPLRRIEGVAAPIAPLFEVDQPAIVIEAVKLAEDGSGDVVVRAYESTGARVRGRIVARFETTSVVETDLLEREVPAAGLRSAEAGTARLELRPFQLVTLRFRRS
ncbi:MAG TPA: glycoside hydrolase family 38 C-terminal domain-containing protein [Propionibacteriaceae bacterium]